MPNRWAGLLELAIVFGLVLAWAVRELVALRRANRAADEDARHEAGRGGNGHAEAKVSEHGAVAVRDAP